MGTPKLSARTISNVTVDRIMENQEMADARLSLFSTLPVQHKNIICRPLLENVNIEKYLTGGEFVLVGGEFDRSAHPAGC
jgi:hypothetical protein